MQTTTKISGLIKRWVSWPGPHRRAFIIICSAAVAIILSGVVALALVVNMQSPKPAATGKTANQKPETATTTKPTEPQASNNTSPATPEKSTPKPAVLPPAVLDGCTYVYGPPNGNHCPKMPPPSFAEQPCYYADPTFFGMLAPSCPPYEETKSIIAVYEDSTGDSYCNFTYAKGEFFHYRHVKVTNSNSSALPDCSVEHAV